MSAFGFGFILLIFPPDLESRAARASMDTWHLPRCSPRAYRQPGAVRLLFVALAEPRERWYGHLGRAKVRHARQRHVDVRERILHPARARRRFALAWVGRI